jgi:BTB/POZ domain-containing protein 9
MELATSVSDYLKAILNINNVCLIYDMANMFSLKSLCNVCMEFIDRNALDILHGENFLALSQVKILL